MKTLHIDTSSNTEIIIGLAVDGQKDTVKKEVDARRAQVVLPMIEDVLTKHQLQLKDLNAIEVELGPGSFTGLRVGVSIANSLGFLLQIPINGNPVGKLVEPVYQ